MPTTRISDLVTIAARLTGCTVEQIKGKQRFKRIVRVRQAIAHIAVQQGIHSTPQIGKALGGRDHSTIIYANRQAANIASRDEDYAHLIERIRLEAEAADPFLEGWGEQYEFKLPVVKPKAPRVRRPMFACPPEPHDSGMTFHAGMAKGSANLLAALLAA